MRWALLAGAAAALLGISPLSLGQAKSAAPKPADPDAQAALYAPWAKDMRDHDWDIAGAYIEKKGETEKGVTCADVLSHPANTPAARSMAMICADPNLARQARLIQRTINTRQWQYAAYVEDGTLSRETAQKGLEMLKRKHAGFLEALKQCDGNRNCILDAQRYRLCELDACIEKTDDERSASQESEKSTTKTSVIVEMREYTGGENGQ